MAPAMKNHMSVETTQEAIPLGREEGVPMASPQGIERKGTGVITVHVMVFVFFIHVSH